MTHSGCCDDHSWRREPFFVSMVVAGWLSIVGSVDGQGQVSGVIHGVVKDQQGAVLRSVMLAATSPAAPLTYDAASDDGGYYRLVSLPPGTYVVTANLHGFGTFTQDNVRVGAGQTLALDIVLQLGAVDEVVEVKHVPPMLEVSRPGQTINIAGDFQRDVPLTRTGEWSQAMMMVPGAASFAARDSASYRVHGADSQSSVFQLDGVDVMPAQLNTDTRTRLSVDAIADVQVRTSVADASAPMGAMILANIITRSGTNEFHGMGNFVYQHRNWYTSNVPGGTTERSSLNQPSATLGGPLVRDRAWFLGSYQYNKQVLGISRTPTQLANLVRIDPRFVPFDNVQSASFAFGKISQHIGNVDITFSSQYDRNPRTSAGPTDAGQYRSIRTGGPQQTGQLSWVLTPTVVSRFAVTYNTKGDEVTLADASKAARNIYETSRVSGATRVGVTNLGSLDSTAGTGLESSYSKLVISADITHTRPTRIGSHDISFGVYYQRQPEIFRTILANGGFYLQEEVLRDPSNPALGTIPFHTVTGSPTSVLTLNNHARDAAVYVQDMWRPHSRVTVAGGLRVDSVSRRDGLFDLRVQNSVELSPRIGVTVALDAGSRNIVHGAFGRIQDALSRTRVTGTGTATLTLQDSYDLDLDGMLETTFVTPGGVKVAPNRRYDGDFHQPYVNDVTAGYRRQLWGQTALDITWLRRDFRDDVALVEVNGIYDGVVFKGYRDELQSNILLLTNNTWNHRLHQDLSIQLSKRWSKGQFHGSYTRAFQHKLAGTWEPNNPSSFLQAETFPDDKAVPINWRDHAVRLAGSVTLPAAFQVATQYTFQSGVWSGPITTRIVAADPTFGPASLTLSNGRLVQNPLATTTRFAFATRGDGQLQADATNVIDLRIARQFAVPFARGELSLSVFNLANGNAAQFMPDTNLTSSTFGLKTQVQPPRVIQIGIRVDF